MKISRGIEVTVGLFVALGLAAILVLAMKVSNLTEVSGAGGYEVIAHFDNVGGLKVRSPVAMGGVRIGRVSGIEYDNTRYQALVHMSIDRRYDRIPVDTGAGIFTAGLLGEKYVGMEPGGADEYLKDNDEITITQPALLLEQVIGQFLYSKAADGGGTGK